ncbi:diguanylate phosphodiesterase [Pseudoalteromonas lipolytica SCSIO 04301]|uniref:EAL domain-containing protein n=1 Tax=Pseudoalteromonas lipolytica TaxID=570156 RepID=UPI000451172C|nr:EAL domain-containing protein [Pseudoalteromonas lipolytica]EWH05525.1 diguanylate phosphodiesterase [Pseudoalteromonas lipolytica SCSIO 04301]
MRTNQTNCQQVSCKLCEDNLELGFDFTMAFQPIIDCSAKNIFGYEALVRGPNNESADSVISQVNDDNRYTFDQLCRVKAISLAAKLALPSILSINFLPNAIYQPERCIKTTLAAAQKYNFPVKQIMFEFTEVEQVEDTAHIKRVIEYYQSLGFITATDDFGSGYSGLNLLADFQSNIIKLDMELVRDIHLDKARQTIVSHCIAMFEELNITPLAEGIECIEEYQWLRSAGVSLMQGYLFARPGFECLPEVDFSLLN